MSLNNSPFENIEEPTETTPPTKKMALFNGKPIKLFIYLFPPTSYMLKF
jgi:hypothetical protein